MAVEQVEQNELSFCWSCGNPPESCICGAETVPMKVELPSTPPPHCGGQRKYDLFAKGSSAPDEVRLRPCCKCGKSWECDYYTNVHGTCPHCGATGNQNPHNFFSKLENRLTTTEFSPQYTMIKKGVELNFLEKPIKFDPNNLKKFNLTFSLQLKPLLGDQG